MPHKQRRSTHRVFCALHPLIMCVLDSIWDPFLNEDGFVPIILSSREDIDFSPRPPPLLFPIKSPFFFFGGGESSKKVPASSIYNSSLQKRGRPPFPRQVLGTTNTPHYRLAPPLVEISSNFSVGPKL